VGYGGSECARVSDGLVLVNLSLRVANAYVEKHHRKNGPVRGMKFAIGAVRAGELVGVCIVGRPQARADDDGKTACILRTAVPEGNPNVCSWLLGRAKRAAHALGFTRVVTHTHQDEGGASLRAVGAKCLGVGRGGSWTSAGRPRVDPADMRGKLRWELSNIQENT